MALTSGTSIQDEELIPSGSRGAFISAERSRLTRESMARTSARSNELFAQENAIGDTAKRQSQPLEVNADVAPDFSSSAGPTQAPGVDPSRLQPRQMTKATATGPFVQQEAPPLTEDQIAAQRERRADSIRSMTVERAKWEASVGLIKPEDLGKVMGNEDPKAAGDAFMTANKEQKASVAAKAAGAQAEMSIRSSMSRKEWMRAQTDSNSDEAKTIDSVRRVTSALAGSDDRVELDDIARIERASDPENRGRFQDQVSSFQKRAMREVTAGVQQSKTITDSVLASKDFATMSVADYRAAVDEEIAKLPPVQRAAAERASVELPESVQAKRKIEEGVAGQAKQREEVLQENRELYVTRSSSDSRVRNQLIDSGVATTEAEVAAIMDGAGDADSKEGKAFDVAVSAVGARDGSVYSYNEDGVTVTKPVEPKTPASMKVGGRVLEGRQMDSITKQSPQFAKPLDPNYKRDHAEYQKGDAVVEVPRAFGNEIGRLVVEDGMDIDKAYEQVLNAEAETNDAVDFRMLDANVGETAIARAKELIDAAAVKVRDEQSPVADADLKENVMDATLTPADFPSSVSTFLGELGTFASDTSFPVTTVTGAFVDQYRGDIRKRAEQELSLMTNGKSEMASEESYEASVTKVQNTIVRGLTMAWDKKIADSAAQVNEDERRKEKVAANPDFGLRFEGINNEPISFRKDDPVEVAAMNEWDAAGTDERKAIAARQEVRNRARAENTASLDQAQGQLAAGRVLRKEILPIELDGVQGKFERKQTWTRAETEQDWDEYHDTIEDQYGGFPDLFEKAEDAFFAAKDTWNEGVVRKLMQDEDVTEAAARTMVEQMNNASEEWLVKWTGGSKGNRDTLEKAGVISTDDKRKLEADIPEEFRFASNEEYLKAIKSIPDGTRISVGGATGSHKAEE